MKKKYFLFKLGQKIRYIIKALIIILKTFTMLDQRDKMQKKILITVNFNIY